MKVLFLTTGYLPTHEEWLRLESWQRELSLWSAQLSYMHKEKGFSPSECQLSKAIFHNGIRSKWRVITGQKSEISDTKVS